MMPPHLNLACKGTPPADRRNGTQHPHQALTHSIVRVVYSVHCRAQRYSIGAVKSSIKIRGLGIAGHTGRVSAHQRASMPIMGHDTFHAMAQATTHRQSMGAFGRS